MKKGILALMVLTSSVMSAEVGVKLGNANLKDEKNRSTNLEAYVALYANILVPVTPIFEVGPSFEVGYGKKSRGEARCKTDTYTGTCKIDYAYSTAEANAHAVLNITPVVDIYAGAGVSYNKFGLKATTPSGTSLGYLSDETGNGVQAYVGAQVEISGLGIGLEVKYKKVSTETISSVFVGTLNLFMNF